MRLPRNPPNQSRRRSHANDPTRIRRTFATEGEHSFFQQRKLHNSGGLARGSRSLAVAVLGWVTNGPPSIGVALVNATSGISLGRPSNGNSFRKGKNG